MRSKPFFIYLFTWLLLAIEISCHSQTNEVRKSIVHLDIDSTYRSSEEKIKYYDLKKEFEKAWLDTSNCFTSDYRVDPKYPDEYNFKKILDFKIDNIFHTPNYDTVAVLVALYAAWVNKDGSKDGELTRAYIMKATIDKGKWYFDCDMNNFSFYLKGKEMEKTLNGLKEMVISSGYLDDNGRPNPKYIHDLFVKEVEFR